MKRVSNSEEEKKSKCFRIFSSSKLERKEDYMIKYLRHLRCVSLHVVYHNAVTTFKSKEGIVQHFRNVIVPQGLDFGGLFLTLVFLYLWEARTPCCTLGRLISLGDIIAISKYRQNPTLTDDIL